MMMESSDPPHVLRKKVMSPGGTTEAAVESMLAGRLRDELEAAVLAAWTRSKELDFYRSWERLAARLRIRRATNQTHQEMTRQVADRLRGVSGNRHGVGARVKVTASGLTQIDEVHSGRGYQSHYGMRLHFGLGASARIDRIEVRWIGGGTDTWENLQVDRQVTLLEGG